jgi:SAM-dependent methyltransferase
MKANYLEYEFLYSAKRNESGWNTPLVDAEISSHIVELLREAQLHAPATVLELGCGMGNLTIPLSDRGFKVTGLDISPTAVAAAQKILRARGNSPRYIVADITSSEAYRDLPLFDCVVDSLCLHCIIGQDRQTVLAHVRKVLRPGGFFLVLTMCGDPRSNALRSHFDARSRCTCHGSVADRYLGRAPQILEEVKEAGFRIKYHRVVDGSDESGDQDMLIAIAVSP